MNEERRKRLRQAIKVLYDARSDIENVMEDEDDARDNMPENLMESQRYYDSEEASEAMANAIDNIDEAVSTIEEVV